MRLVTRAVATALPFAAVIAMSGSASAATVKVPNGQKAAFFTGGTGTAGWVNGNDGFVPGDTDGKVMQLSSPDGSSYGGFVAHAIDGVAASDINALSYDFQVTTPGWTGGGLGSPRLVVEFSDSTDSSPSEIALNPVTDLTPGTWYHMDAGSGAVDNEGGTCGFLYQASLSTALACHPGVTVMDAFVVDDSGWSTAGPFAVQVDNLTLNDTVYSTPGTAKK